MYVVTCKDNKTLKTFDKVFWNYKLFKGFINKAKRGKALTIIKIVDNSKFYD